MLLQVPPRAEAVLTCNYEPRVEKVWVGQVSEGSIAWQVDVIDAMGAGKGQGVLGKAPPIGPRLRRGQ